MSVDKNWIKFQPNPHRCKDCGVRALVCATGLSWFEIFDELVEESRTRQLMPSSAEVISTIASRHEFSPFYKLTYNSVAGKELDGGMYLNAFLEKFPKGTYLVAGDDHIICVKDGKYYDDRSSNTFVKCYAEKI